MDAGYHCAFEVCVASHLEVKAAIACVDARLLGHRQVVSIDLAFAEVEIDVCMFLSDKSRLMIARMRHLKHYPIFFQVIFYLLSQLSLIELSLHTVIFT